MGIGYGYRCRNCKKEYSVYLGEGMLFSKTYKKELGNIANGKYGSEFQELVKSHQYVAIDAEKAVYSCSRCIKWKEEYVLDLYIPKNPDDIPNKVYGIKTVAEWGYVPYVLKWQIESDYELLKKFIHRCPDCGTPTHRVEDKEFRQLPCPRCKNKNKICSFINWD